MVHARVVQHIHQRASRTGFRITRTEDKLADTAMHHRPGTHHAGFKRNVQGGINQTVVLQHHPATAQRHDFRMCGGIVAANGTVPAFTNNLIIVDQHRANRHFAFFPRAFCQR